jgi:serine phosphatase RsbU (regulator of sigma subunit)
MDGSLWLLVADVTGHGLPAYLISSGLPDVWRMCWDIRKIHREPFELLAAIHDELAEFLPDDVFVEGALAHLQLNGRVTIAPAGSRLLMRTVDGATKIHELVGGWLGLFRPTAVDQLDFFLAAGDELMLATDGMFGQLAVVGFERVHTLCRDGALFDAVASALRDALAHEPQSDDIAAVVASRRSNLSIGVS